MRVFILVTRSTFLEFWRQPLVLFLLLGAAVGTGGGWWWRELNFGENEARFILNFGGGVQGLVGVLVCTVGVAQTWTREFEQHTAGILKARALSGIAMVAGKACGVWLIALVFLGVSTTWLALLVGGQAETMELVREGGATLSRAGKLGLVATCATWFASYGQSALFVVLASWAVVLMGNLQGLIGPDSLGGQFLQLIVPDLRWFDVAPAGAMATVGAGWIGRLVLYNAIYVAVFVGLAALSWRRREH